MDPPATTPVPGVAEKVELMHLIERLKTQTRTGWVRVGVPGRVESIADHMYRMAMLSLLSEDDPELDIAKCVQMAVVHDLAEALVGDITPDDGISPAEKQRLETEAMDRMTKVLLNPAGPASKRIRSLYHEYEERSSKEAKFVKDLDRIEMALQGQEYELDRRSDKIQPFFRSSIPKIEHPEVRTWAKEMMSRRRAEHANDTNYAHVDISEPVASTSSASTVPPTPDPLVTLSSTSLPVLDADEEIFDLYTHLSTASKAHAASDPPEKPHGLGFVDSKRNRLTISIEVQKLCLPTSPTHKPRARGKRRPSAEHAGSSVLPDGPKVTATNRRNSQSTPTTLVEVDIQQDLSSLHSRAGDTGSVVWQASVLLAKVILDDVGLGRSSLLSPELFAQAEVLELGGGTGVLSTLLAPLAKSWTVTDIANLLPLITKNHRFNETRLASADLRVTELDWTYTDWQFRQSELLRKRFDLILAVDCLFNEALVAPFVQTLNRLSAKYVILVSELRSANVLEAFLEQWLKGGWIIYRAMAPSSETGSNSGDADGLLGRRHVVWVGWKVSV